jgi:hypothetical protein
VSRALSHFDVKNLDDRSVIDLGFVEGAERVRRRPVARWNLLTVRAAKEVAGASPDGCTQLNVQTATASSDIKPYGPTNDTSDRAEFSLNRLGVAMARTATTMSAIALNRFGPLAGT